jgi:hypothetical protein
VHPETFSKTTQSPNSEFALAYPFVLQNYVEMRDLCGPRQSSTQRFCELRAALEADDILAFLRLILIAMHNIPREVNQTIRKYEAHPHSIVHLVLWLCCPRTACFESECSSQDGRCDVVFVNKFRHYIELKNEDSRDSAEDALSQIEKKSYDMTFPRSEQGREKPAFFYGVKWTNTSTTLHLRGKCAEESLQSQPYGQRVSRVRTINRSQIVEKHTPEEHPTPTEPATEQATRPDRPIVPKATPEVVQLLQENVKKGLLPRRK